MSPHKYAPDRRRGNPGHNEFPLPLCVTCGHAFGAAIHRKAPA